MKILLATDGSKHAQAARELLKRLPLPASVELTIMTVLEPEKQLYPDEMLITDAAQDMLRQWRESERAAAQQRLAGEAAAFTKKGWTITTQVGEGHIAQQIIDTADTSETDLIAVGARGLSAIKRFLLGSVSATIMRHAPCSVLIARTADEAHGVASEPQADTAMRILVAYDASPAARAAIDMLETWSLSQQTQIHLLTVLTLITYYRMDILQHLSAEWQAERRHAQEELDRVADRLRRLTPQVTAEVREGPDPSQIILDAAADLPASLVMLGQAGKSGIEHFFLGSVANHVVHHAPCSILLARQRGADAAAS